MNIIKICLFFHFLLLQIHALALEKPVKIMIMGDSLSAAYGILQEQSWVKLLEEETGKKYSLEFINASVSGETTAGGKARLPALLAAHQPQIVLLELGGNDGLRAYPVKIIRQNLQDMLAQIKAAKADGLLMGIQIPGNYGQVYTQAFKSIYPELAAENQVAYLPFFLSEVATQTKLMQADGIHPNASAQPLLAAKVKTSLLKIIIEKYQRQAAVKVVNQNSVK
ncbi:arylesterase [Undibacterium sp. Di27W]|uniref:arylesterase n=1 Tax=Undibacterium sp. Di27W TaxID=3413036 RepID=UPI003BF2BE3C